jgi:hypothetical protein
LNPLSLDNFIVDYKVSIGLDQGIQLSIPDLLSDTVNSLKIKENNFVKKNKALVYHDSYFYAMEQFLNIHYKEIIKHSFVFEDNLNKIEDEAIKNNVDLLLLISLERHLGNHLNRVLLNNR